jgi:hypothetical protein
MPNTKINCSDISIIFEVYKYSGLNFTIITTTSCKGYNNTADDKYTETRDLLSYRVALFVRDPSTPSSHIGMRWPLSKQGFATRYEVCVF